jgi:hypothetical protein
MNISMLCDHLCSELEPCITKIILHDEDQPASELSLSFVLECYDWERYSFEGYNSGLLAKRVFEITCTQYIESSLNVGGFSDMQITDTHPLLFKYSLPHIALYFSVKPNNPHEIVGRLYEAHKESYQEWRPFSDCIHENLIDVLCGGFGLLAQGPKVIMEAYKNSVSDLLKLRAVENDFSKKRQLLLMSYGYIICSNIFVNELTCV